MGRSGYTCIRFLLCSLNVAIWVLGCGVLGIGIWLHLAYGGYATLLPAYSSLSADSLCIISGVITFVVAFFGCCGSWFQNRCLILMYFLLVLLIFAMELSVGTLTFVYKEDVRHTLQKELLAGIKTNYAQEGEKGFTEAWDHIQTNLECCGVNSPTDWYKIDMWSNLNMVPASCCKEEMRNSTMCMEDESFTYIYSKGCYDRLRMWIIERLHIAGLIILAFAFIQLFGLISSMLLFCTLRQRRKSYR